ncbi:hypothetical protein IJH46_01580 [Candidatus Saccharibacteria bacterium]|nr:hypothetical protein [Candidatus Saccharibacteria bacterium]
MGEEKEEKKVVGEERHEDEFEREERDEHDERDRDDRDDHEDRHENRHDERHEEKRVEKIKVDVKELESAPAAKPNVVSIMAAPAEKKKFPLVPVLIGALLVSVVLNVFALVSILSKNESIDILRSEISDYKTEILDLKTQINELTN